MKKTCFLVCVYATLMFFTATSGAQDRVTALVTAVDRSGEAVQLSAADLDITEDGKTISSAVDVRELKTSRRIILIFDASHSGDRSFDFARSTAKSLTYNLMRGGLDTASLVVLHDGRWSDQLWTGNPDAVLNSLASLTPSGKTALYDGILRAWELFERTPASGEHIDILLVLSDGEDNSSSATKGEVFSALRRSGARVYALNTSDVEIQLPGGRFLQQIAAETGGKAWLPYMQQKEAAKATAEIERELRSVYAVSFVQSSQNGRINVKSRNKAVRISSTLVKH